MSLHEDMDRLSITEEVGQDAASQETRTNQPPEGDGEGEVPEKSPHVDSVADDGPSLRKFVSSSSLFEGDQHLFEFIDEPVIPPSPLSDINQSAIPLTTGDQDNGHFVAPAKEEDGSASYNFLDRERESDEKSVESEEELADLSQQDEKKVSETLNAPSPSIGRSTKGRAPPPPAARVKSVTMCTTDGCAGGCQTAGMSYADGSDNWQFSIPVPHKTHYHICPEYRTFDYMAYPSAKVRFYQVGYNTNLKKPTENWVRMKSRYHAKGGESARRTHSTSHSYSHYYGYEHNWLSYAFAPRPQAQNLKKYSVPSSWKSRKQFLSHFSAKSQSGMRNFDNSLCMCCVCCNCAKTNQTNCCCCYHCVHTISACRRSDVLRMIPLPSEPSSTPGAIVSILKKKGASDAMHDPPLLPELDQSHEQEYCPDTKPPPCTPDAAADFVSCDEERPASSLLPTAPSPTVSGATPTTEPTELDMDDRRVPVSD